MVQLLLSFVTLCCPFGSLCGIMAYIMLRTSYILVILQDAESSLIWEDVGIDTADSVKGGKMFKKAYKGCLVTATVTIIAIIVAIVALLLILRGCMGRNALDRDQIIQFVLDNEELFNNAVEEIWGLDEHVNFISNTRFSPGSELDFVGLYTIGMVLLRNAVQFNPKAPKITTRNTRHGDGTSFSRKCHGGRESDTLPKVAT